MTHSPAWFFRVIPGWTVLKSTPLYIEMAVLFHKQDGLRAALQTASDH